MASKPERPPGGLPAALRRAVRGIEGRHIEADAGAALTPLGLADLDHVLGGGLSRAALHEIAAASEAEIAAASFWALALAGRSARARAVLWIAEDGALAESGVPYGPGLDGLGLFPERVVTVVAARPREVLWAMEEALRCRGVGAVIGEFRENGIDGVAARRLSLAAHKQGTPALLLRARPDARPLAATTRWVVRAVPARHVPDQTGSRMPAGPGPPALAVDLTRNRYGPVGSWVLEWNRAEQCFVLAPAHPQPVAAEASDRPRGAAAG